MPARLRFDQLHLRHLALVSAIAEHRQLSLAASALRISQPAASRTLAEAEARVGGPLFLRQPKGLDLTPVGDALVRRARNILNELADAQDEVARLRQGRGGVVRIGAVTGAAVGYVAPALRHLRTLMPEVELHVDVGTSDALMAGLLSLRHDLILARLPPRLPVEPLTLRLARGETIHIVAHPSHRLAQRDVATLADLIDDEWVMQGPGTPIRRAMEESFLAKGLALPRLVVNTASLLMVMALVDHPATVCAVSAEVADLLTNTTGGLIRLPMESPITVAPYSLISLRDHQLSPAAARYHDVLASLIGGKALTPSA